MAHPHDALFKAVFSSPSEAAGLLRPLLPAPAASAIDWTRLELVPGSFVDEALQHRHTDLLFQAPIGRSPGLLYFLCEHKSRPERFVALHLLGYMARIWAQWRRDHRRARTLPRIVPVVLHHGRQAWTAPTDLRGLFEEGATAFDALGADLTYVVDDLGRIDDAALRRRAMSPWAQLALALLRSVRGSDTAQLVALMQRWLDAVAAVLAGADGRERIMVLWSYILEITEGAAEPLGEVLDAAGPGAKESLMSIANKLRAEGRTEGRAEGKASIVLRLLTLRFGPLPAAVVERVRTGTTADLDRWADAVLSAPSLDAVFAD